MKAPKWYDGKESVIPGDICYFRKVENELSSSWTIGKVIDVVHSKDGVVRRATIEYQNENENVKRTTDRAARSLIKLFHIDDKSWYHEMSKVEKIIEDLNDDKNDSTIPDEFHGPESLGELKGHETSSIGIKLAAWVKKAKKQCKVCCCLSHCNIETHGKAVKFPVQSPVIVTQFEMTDSSEFTEEERVEMFANDVANDGDGLTALISSVHMDLDLDESQ